MKKNHLTCKSVFVSMFWLSLITILCFYGCKKNFQNNDLISENQPELSLSSSEKIAKAKSYFYNNVELSSKLIDTSNLHGRQAILKIPNFEKAYVQYSAIGDVVVVPL